MGKETLSFDEGLEKLTAIVEKMEQGDLGLEASLKEYEAGMKLIASCNAKLDAAQKKVLVIRGDDSTDEFDETDGR